MEAPEPEELDDHVVHLPSPVTDGENARLVAWSRELRTVHNPLRAALRVTRDAVADGGPAAATGEPELFCHGFCTALTGRHEVEDRLLFPHVAAASPDLARTLRQRQQDHAMIAHLVTAL